jgi:hypothetical protein
METVACQLHFESGIVGGAVKKHLPHSYISNSPYGLLKLKASFKRPTFIAEFGRLRENTGKTARRLARTPLFYRRLDR